MRYIIAALCAAFLAAPAAARWGTCVSGAVAPLARARTFSKLEWIKDRSAPGQLDLVGDGWKLIGAYDPETGIYRHVVDFNRGLWSDPEPLPENAPLPPVRFLCRCQVAGDLDCICRNCECHPEAAADEPVIENHGLNLAELELDGKEKASISGKPVKPAEAIRAVENGLPDDAHKFCVTAIGVEELREKFVKEFAASDLAQTCKLQSYSADAWELNDLDANRRTFVVDTPLSLYLQAPDGQVLWRQGNADGAIENMRKETKKYDPKKDPGPHSPALPALHDIPMPLLILGALAVLAFLTRRKEAS